MNYVLVSGWATRPRALDALQSTLESKERVRTYSVHDLPSLPSDDAADTEGLSEYARGLAGLLARNPEPCVLLGWSMGGMVALETAVRHPEWVSHLVAVCTTARFVSSDDTPWGVPVGQIKGLARLLRISPREALKVFFRHVASPAEPTKERVRDDVKDALSWGVNRLIHGLHYLQHIDLRHHLAQFDIPTLVIHGEDDAIISQTGGAELAASLSRGRFELLPGIGHDAPRRCATGIASWCRDFTARGANG